MKHKQEDNTHYLPIFMGIGLSVGVAIGATANNIPVWISIGLCIGVDIGTAFDGQNRENEE